MKPGVPTTTEVIACCSRGETRLELRTVRPLAAGEALLRVSVSGLCGTDLFKLAHDTAAPGSVLGHEIVGEVVAVGPGVSALASGQRVVVPHHVACGACGLCARGSDTLCAVFRENLLDPGGFSRHVVVGERAVRSAARVVPESIADEAMVFLEPAACVLRGVERSGLAAPGASSPRATAVVLGAGSMGLLHLLVLRAARPGTRVIVADLVPERLALAVRLGAEAAAAPEGAGLEALVREASGGLGADAVFDTVGGAAALRAALALAREGGTVVLFAHARAGESAELDLNELFKHERRVIGTYSGGLREQAAVFDLIASGRLDASPLVTHRLPFSRFAEGVELTRRRQALKVLFVPETAAG